MRNSCSNLEPNTACFGSGPVEIVLKEGIEATFASPGDRVSLSDVVSLKTFPMDVMAGEFGIVVMNVEASSAGTIVMMTGDAYLEDASAEHDGFAPMQAFYFDVGTEPPPCEYAPSSSVFIIVPRGYTADLVVNDVDMELSSGMLLWMIHSSLMGMNLLRGHAQVSTGNQSLDMSSGETRLVTLGPPDQGGRRSASRISCSRFPSPWSDRLSTYFSRCYMLSGTHCEPGGVAPDEGAEEYARECGGPENWSSQPEDSQGDVYLQEDRQPAHDNAPAGADIRGGSARIGGSSARAQGNAPATRLSGDPYCGGGFGHWGDNQITDDTPYVPPNGTSLLTPGAYTGTPENGSWWSASDSPILVSHDQVCPPEQTALIPRSAGLAFPSCQDGETEYEDEYWFIFPTGETKGSWQAAYETYMAQIGAMEGTAIADWFQTAWQAANGTDADWSAAMPFSAVYSPGETRHGMSEAFMSSASAPHTSEETSWVDDIPESYLISEECRDFLRTFPTAEFLVNLSCPAGTTLPVEE